MDKNIMIREYRAGDEIAIMKLRGLVLSGSKDMDWWVWQRKQNPAGQAIMTVVEDRDRKEIIGHNCLLPLRMKHEDKTYLFIMSVDTMIHPDYRGQGLYPRIIRTGWEFARKRHVQYAYNILSEFITRIGKGSGSDTIFKNTPLWIKPLNLGNVVANYFTSATIPAYFITTIGKAFMKLRDRSRNYQLNTHVREVKEIDERFDTLWRQASSHHKTMLVRDRAYLDWRYIKRPDVDYTVYISEQDDQLLGYIVLRIVESNDLKVGWIMDVLTSAQNNLAAMDLINQAYRYFEALDIDAISCVMPPKAYIVPNLRKHGFLMMSRWSRRETAIRIREITKGHPQSSLSNPNNWYLTQGDSDTL